MKTTFHNNTMSLQMKEILEVMDGNIDNHRRALIEYIKDLTKTHALDAAELVQHNLDSIVEIVKLRRALTDFCNKNSVHGMSSEDDDSIIDNYLVLDDDATDEEIQVSELIKQGMASPKVAERIVQEGAMEHAAKLAKIMGFE